MGTQDKPIHENNQVKMNRWYQALLVISLIVIFYGIVWIVIR